MSKTDRKKLFINYILSNPDSIKLKTDKAGYTTLNAIMSKCRENNYNIDMEDLKDIDNDKYFKLVNRGQFIKAKTTFKDNKEKNIFDFEDLKNE